MKTRTISPRVYSLLAGALWLAACGEDPVSYSGPVGIELKADADKVTTAGGPLTDSKHITDETGNPYGAFIGAARDVLGHDPSRIEVTGVTVLLGADSTGVTMLGEIFDGSFEVLFEMSDTHDTFAAAHGTIDATTQGGGPIVLTIDYDAETFTGTNLQKLISGGFNVVYRGPTQPTYMATTAKADLQITLTFEAFE